MRRNTFLLFAGMLMAIVMLLTAAPNRAYAQQDPKCCDYIVNSMAIPAGCFPIVLTITWSAGSTSVTMPTPGFYSFHIPFGCPPAPAFVGGIVTSATGCCFRVRHAFCHGCLFIDFVPC